MAGTRSVPKSIHKMVIVPSGSGMASRMNIRKGEISGMLLVSVYAIDFFKLSKIRRPADRKSEQRQMRTTLNELRCTEEETSHSLCKQDQGNAREVSHASLCEYITSIGCSRDHDFFHFRLW